VFVQINRIIGLYFQTTKPFYTTPFASHIAEVTFQVGKPRLMQYNALHKSYNNKL